jgi:hypothetical protein
VLDHLPIVPYYEGNNQQGGFDMTTAQPGDSPPVLFGAIFAGAGVLLFLVTIFDRESAFDGPPILSLMGSIAFFLPGLWLMGAHRLFARRIGAEHLDWNTIWVGLITVWFGLMIMIISVVDDESNFEAPRWVVTAAGAVFLLVGVLVLRAENAKNAPPDNVFSGVITAIMLTCFGAVVTWVSLGPGEREFQGSISFLFFSFDTQSSEFLGRLCFLPGTILLDAMAIVTWFRVFQKIFRRKLTQDETDQSTWKLLDS